MVVFYTRFECDLLDCKVKLGDFVIRLVEEIFKTTVSSSSFIGINYDSLFFLKHKCAFLHINWTIPPLFMLDYPTAMITLSIEALYLISLSNISRFINVHGLSCT